MKNVNTVAALCVLLSAVCALTAFGQEAPQPPSVPLGVFLQGRQSVAKHLIGQVARVDIEFSGRSVLGEYWEKHRILTAEDLEWLGYRHRGSFSELSDAIFSQQFNGSVVRTPEGSYDLNVTVQYLTADGRPLFRGFGSANVLEQPDGNLIVSPFQPFMFMNDRVSVVINADVTAARWIGEGWKPAEEYPVASNGRSSVVVVSTRALEDGYLAIAYQGGNAVAWSLRTGNGLQGHQVVALLGQSFAADIRLVRNPQSIDIGSVRFIKHEGRIYGRFPLIDLVVDQPFHDIVDLKVPIWGTDEFAVPSRGFVTPIYTKDGGRSGLVPGNRYPLPWEDSIHAGYLIVPGGEHHLELDFEGLSNPDELPGKG